MARPVIKMTVKITPRRSNTPKPGFAQINLGGLYGPEPEHGGKYNRLSGFHKTPTGTKLSPSVWSRLWMESTREAIDQAGDLWGQGARRMMRLSQLYAPVDKANLMAAHKMTMVGSNQYHRRVLITVGGIVDGVDVDSYATEMHERLDYNLGPRSKAKAAAFNVRVGPRFLERAMNEVIEPLENTIFAILSDSIF